MGGIDVFPSIEVLDLITMAVVGELPLEGSRSVLTAVVDDTSGNPTSLRANSASPVVSATRSSSGRATTLSTTVVVPWRWMRYKPWARGCLKCE